MNRSLWTIATILALLALALCYLPEVAGQATNPVKVPTATQTQPPAPTVPATGVNDKRIDKLSDEVGDLQVFAATLQAKQEGTVASASLVISWVGFLFSLVTIFLALAAFIAGRRWREFEKLHAEAEQMIKDTKVATEQNRQMLTDEVSRMQKFVESAEEVVFPIVEGQWFYYQGDFSKAINAYERASMIDPDNWRVAYRLNKLRMENGLTEDAIHNLRDFERKHEDNPEVLIQLGKAYRRTGDYEQARDLLCQYTERFDNSWEVDYELGFVFLLLGNLRKSKEYFHSAMTRYSDNRGRPPYWITLNYDIVRRMLGEFEECKEGLHRAVGQIKERLQRTPNNSSLIALLGLAELGLSESNEDIENKALPHFRSAITSALPVGLARSMMERVERLFDVAEYPAAAVIRETLDEYIRTRTGARSQARQTAPA